MQSPSFCSPKVASLETGLPWSCFRRACFSSLVARSVWQELRPPVDNHGNESQGIWLAILSQGFKWRQPWLTSDFPDHSSKSDDSPSPQTPSLSYFVVHCSESVSDSLRPHGLQHAPGFPVLHHLMEFAQTHDHWVGDAIQPSHPLSSLSFPAFNLSQHQGFFPMSWFFSPSGQSMGASAWTSVLPKNIQGWIPLGLTHLIFFLSKELSKESSLATQLESISAFFMAQLSHMYRTARKTIALTTWTFVGKVMSLLLNTLSGFVIAFLLRSKHLLISYYPI